MELKKEKISKLQNFPIMFFAVIMGLGGLSIAYRAVNEVFEISNLIFQILRFFAFGVFVVISIFYIAKIIKYRQSVKAEFSHPIKLNFFAAFPISMMLLSIAFSDCAYAQRGFFYTALVFQTFLTFYIISFWIKNNMLIQHSNPAWFIPIVGNLIVILAAGDSKYQFLWFYFSVGIFFWIVLFSIIFYRIIFHDQLAQKFIPTLFIMIAPPAIAFLDYIKLGGELDVFAQILLNMTIFFIILVFFMTKSFLKIKFFLSWWAFTFPTAAASIAFMKAYKISGESVFAYFGVAMFALLSCLIVIVGFFTLKSIKNGEICIME